MSETKFTPGPWSAPRYDNDTGPNDEGFWEWWDIEGIGRINNKADAYLCAAAPDLYAITAAAPVLSKYHGMSGFEVEPFITDYEDWMARRRAILAKARGEKP